MFINQRLTYLNGLQARTILIDHKAFNMMTRLNCSSTITRVNDKIRKSMETTASCRMKKDSVVQQFYIYKVYSLYLCYLYLYYIPLIPRLDTIYNLCYHTYFVRSFILYIQRMYKQGVFNRCTTSDRLEQFCSVHRYSQR